MNPAGIALLKRWENRPLSIDHVTGLRANWDKIGRRWQIGYGHTGSYEAELIKPTDRLIIPSTSAFARGPHSLHAVTEGDELTGEYMATALLYTDVGIKEKSLLAKLPQSLNINQTSALTCLAYNVGVGAVLNSHLLRSIRPAIGQTKFPISENATIESAWLSWDHGEVHGHEEVIKGLLNRRKDEWSLFIIPMHA